MSLLEYTFYVRFQLKSDNLNLHAISFAEYSSQGRGRGVCFVFIIFTSDLLTAADRDCWLSFLLSIVFAFMREIFLFPEHVSIILYEIYLFIHSADAYLALSCARHY